MGKTSLMPPGFRFHPTDVELVMFYLKRKVLRIRLGFEAIAVVDIYKFTPWDLPDKSALKTGDLKWYFFCPVEKKYSNGARMNRATEIGYWKTTGKDRPVYHQEVLVGWIKTLVFHTGKAPKGERTNWVMHEYRLEDKNLPETAVVQNTYVLCMIFKKDGLGPRNGAQYGAPFKEEDWDDKEIDCVEAGPSAAGLSISTHVLPSNCSSVITGTSFRCGAVSELDLCEIMQSECKRRKATCSTDVVPEYQVPSESGNLPAVLGNNDELISDPKNQVTSENDILPTVLADNDELLLLSMLDTFTEDDTLVSNEDDKTKNLCHDGNPEGTKYDGSDIYKDLGDLSHLDGGPANCFNIYDLDQLLREG